MLIKKAEKIVCFELKLIACYIFGSLEYDIEVQFRIMCMEKYLLGEINSLNGSHYFKVLVTLKHYVGNLITRLYVWKSINWMK